jgi:hypothetical protein
MNYLLDFLPDPYLKQMAEHFASLRPPFPPPAIPTVSNEILARAGSTPAAAVALAESIAMFPVPCSSRKLARALEALAISAHARPRLRHLWLMES